MKTNDQSLPQTKVERRHLRAAAAAAFRKALRQFQLGQYRLAAR